MMRNSYSPMYTLESIMSREVVHVLLGTMCKIGGEVAAKVMLH